MKVPNRVNILGIPYDVVSDDMDDNEDGFISPRRQVIMLRKGLPREFDYQSE